MAYLLWVESLFLSVVVLAAATAWSARTKGNPAARLAVVLAFLAPPAFYIVLAWAINQDYRGAIGNGWVYLRSAGAVLVFLVAAGVICHRGLRVTSETLPVASTWRPRKLVALLILAAAALLVTVGGMEMSIRSRGADLDRRSKELAASVTPPPLAEADNAAVDYRKASKILGPVSKLPKAWAREWTAGQSSHLSRIFPKSPPLRGQVTNERQLLLLLWFGGDFNRPITIMGMTMASPHMVDSLIDATPADANEGGVDPFLAIPLKLMAYSVRSDPNLAHLSGDGSELRNFLSEKAEALDLLRSAGGKARCRFDLDYDHPTAPAMLSEDGLWLRDLQLLLWTSARAHAIDRDANGTVEDIQAMLALAEHAGSCPLPANVLSAMSCDDLAIRTIKALAVTGQLDPAALARIRWNRDFSWREAMKHAMAMNEALSLSVLAELARGDITLADLKDDVKLDAFSTRVYRLLRLSGDVSACERIFANVRGLEDMPFRQAEPGLVSLTEDCPRFFDSVVSFVIVPQAYELRVLADLGDAKRAVVDAALAACRYRNARGRWPEKLADLAPEFLPSVPADPFDGTPLRWLPDEDKIAIYSVGPDGIDSLGAGYNSHTEKGDITVTLRK